MERVAVIGVGMTQFARERPAETAADLVFEACTRALEDARLSIEDVDVVITGSNDFFDGRTISSMAVMDACGSYDKNVSTVEGDGTFGAAHALMRVLAGWGTVLYCAHHKGSESVMPLITNAMFDPIFERFLGIEAVTSAALQARAYMDRWGLDEETLALVSVKNHGNAFRNPVAQLPLETTVEDVMGSPYIADPLKRLDCAPVTDGAAAVILADGEHARSAGSRAVRVRGVGYSCDAFHLGDRDLADPSALRDAAARAYRGAAIDDPARQIDLAEVSEVFGYMELMWCEGLGLCGPGEAGEMTASGRTARDGDIPVNVSGGCLSANPVLVSGLNRVIECVLQVRGEAGEHQVEGVRTAVAQGFNGPCGQSQCVWVLGGEE
ncbi:MAG: thiolase family protein [Actinobacteria bacterium]|nr:thiolase family protein [Actinomycetota bacterium]